MADRIALHRDGTIAILPIDAPIAGARLADALAALEADPALDALVVRLSGDADVTAGDLPALVARIEAAARPVVAALDGTVQGAALELALGCHARIAAPGARVRFPGVAMGLIPGAGGIQRALRLAGVAATIDLVVEGKPLDAARALDKGLIDRIADGALDAAAVALARSLAGAPPRRTRDLPAAAADDAALTGAEANARRRQRGREAPLAALAAIRFGLDHGFDAALAHDAARAQEALVSPQAQALHHIAAAERAVARPPSLDPATAPRAFGCCAVVGLGTMGRGIVVALAAAGLPVVAIARDDGGLDKARAAVAKTWAQQVARGRIDAAERAARDARVTWSSDLADAAHADIVIESIREERAAKEAAFAALGDIAKRGAILASNTSYLDIDALGAASGRPADSCGMHFFNPADVMPLIECVQGAATAPDVVATVLALARRLGKIGVVSGVCDGFIVNRLLAKRSREAYFLLEEGASPWAIDRVLVAFGFPMGPFALGDLAGIDVQHAARVARADRLTPRERRADFVDQLFAARRFGRRAGAGWYRYGDDGKPAPDPEIDALVAAHARRHGIARREIGDDEIRDRLIFAMVNEGARLIDEGVVARPDEIDVAMVNGIGFPRHLGGPMWWADAHGLDRVADAVALYRAAHGDIYWAVSPTLEQRGRFY